MRYVATAYLLALTVGPASAAVLDLQFEISISSAYAYPTGTYVPYPFAGIVDLRLDLGNLKPIDYGSTTISYGGDGSAVFNSPLTPFVGQDPIGAGLDGAYSYVFPHTSASGDLLLEQVAAQSNAYSSNGTDYWSYHTELRIDHRSSVTGVATNYAMSLDDMLRVVGLWYRDPSIGHFNEYWGQYTFNSEGNPIYSAGHSWSDYSSILRFAWLDGNAIDLETMKVNPAPVPLPATGFLLAGALAGMGALRARRKCNSLPRNAS